MEQFLSGKQAGVSAGAAPQFVFLLPSLGDSISAGIAREFPYSDGRYPAPSLMVRNEYL
jgi:hypothetical protein